MLLYLRKCVFYLMMVLAGMVHNSGDYLHMLIEALSLSFADTLWYNADPSKVKVPINGLLSKQYADQRRLLIKPHRFVYVSVAALNLEHPPNVTISTNTIGWVFFVDAVVFSMLACCMNYKLTKIIP